MSRLCSLLMVLVSVLLPSSSLATLAETRRNFVFVLVDDLGWADLSCYGSTFHRTPHLDALAARGIRFERAYAACPVCSPTRASILTGRHPVRVQITDWIPGDSVKAGAGHRFLHVQDRDELALEQLTLAEILREEGYQTFFAGKWHLGGDGFLPTQQGFDVNLGGGHYGQPPHGYFAPWKIPSLPEGADGEYLTERLTAESVRFLRQRDQQRPFLLFLSHYDVHTPIHKAPGHFEQYALRQADLGAAPQPISERRGRSRARQDNPQYASMVSAIDDSVAALVAELEAQQLLGNTTIIFTSDNGGLCTLKNPGPTSNLPLRSGKGWLYEGGIRVPLIVWSPEIAGRRAGAVVSAPVLSTDYLPTMLQLAGLPQPAGVCEDGQSFAAELSGEGIVQTRPLAWHYPHYHGSEWTPGAAFQRDGWKVIEFYEQGDAELYDLSSDPGERNNLAAREPAKLAELRRALRDWQSQMGAVMPQPDPAWRAP